MTNAANITIKPNAQLHIYIKANEAGNSASATIITNSGESVELIPLSAGDNVIDITPFIYKNYAVRVVNGKNVTVQKI